MTLLPEKNRVRIAKIPLDIVASDFLHHHAGAAEAPTYTNGRVLRQKHLPDDAKILYARCDYEENPPVLIVAIQSAKYRPVESGKEPELEIDRATLLPPGPEPVVGEG
jgi:hypothetical protein